MCVCLSPGTSTPKHVTNAQSANLVGNAGMLKYLGILFFLFAVYPAMGEDRSFQSVSECRAKLISSWNWKVPADQATQTVRAFQKEERKCLDGSGKHRRTWERLMDDPTGDSDITVTVTTNLNMGYLNNPLRQGYEPINRTHAFDGARPAPQSHPR